MALLLASAPTHCQPAADTITRPGVELTYEEGVDETNLQAIAHVVSVAKAAFDALFPRLAQERLHVHVWDATQAYWEGALTDRLSTVYIGLGSRGLGEEFRPDADPVGILCQAVAELHNPSRLPGFDRYVAHRCLAPAVAKALGATPLPRTRLNPNVEDVTGRLGIMIQPEYASVHPDFAAVAAMVDIEHALGLEALKELLLTGLSRDGDPFGRFRSAALAKEPALADAFELYEQATELPVQADGTCLVASFEPGEPVRVRADFAALASRDDFPIVASNPLKPSFGDEWATDGRLSLKLQANQIRPYLALILSDPDWRYKDWTRFRRFEMDLRYEGPAPAEVYAYVADDVGRGHATLALTEGFMQPGDVRHVLVDLTDDLLTKGRPRTPQAYYDGAFRVREVAALQITVPDPPGPFTLYVDNLRLTPRETASAAPPAEPPAGAGLEERRAKASALTQEAVALKRQGHPQLAEQRLREALKLDTDSPETHRVLGWLLADLGRKADAIAEFETVLKLNPDDKVRAEAEEALQKLR